MIAIKNAVDVHHVSSFFLSGNVSCMGSCVNEIISQTQRPPPTHNDHGRDVALGNKKSKRVTCNTAF